MDDRFALLQEIVLGRAPAPQEVDGFVEPSHRRLVRALRGPVRPGDADLSALVRHVLRREEARQGGVPQEWWVPRASGWPTVEGWQGVGVEIRSNLADRFRIRAREWTPAWLPESQESPPCRSVEAEEMRRNFAPTPGDPWLREMGWDSYRCGAQREMMRGVLSAPPGSTLLCNLPTGAGKSLLAHLPALLRSRREGVSVVVVPTTALAMDQERAIAEFVPHPTAYHPGTLLDGSDRRRDIRQRILQGDQRIVFTSPESVIGGLSPVLYAAAERDLLRFFAIDEAHIVSDWGGEFRSAFQELAGLRRDLLRTCSGEAFVTLLMTATLSQESVRTLQVLFADPGPFAVSSAVQLRPEPAYWTAWCEEEEIRVTRVLEALRHLPRPLILYTTKPPDADRWFEQMRALGYQRCARVTGDTPTTERQAVVHRWKSADLDVVVATSAFGLGVDQGDVRAVVHACVPESVDRFYQEVGRGGRDGQASLSLVLHTDHDLRVAERLSRKTLIGSDKGTARWRQMFFKKKEGAPGLYRVPVGIAPGVSADRIDMTSRLNRAWNINTLTLMSRAGVLQLDAERPPVLSSEEIDTKAEALDRAQELQHWEFRVVRIRDPLHLDQATWQRRVEPVRSEIGRNSEANLDRMREALRGSRCMAEILADAYRIRTPDGGAVHVVPSCGGCKACRRAGQVPFAGPLPDPRPPWPISRDMGPPLARLLAGTDAVAIFYNQVETYAFERFLRWLVSLGIRSAVLPPGFPEPLRASALEVLGVRSERPVFLGDEFHPRRAPRVPTLILHPRGAEVPARYLSSGHEDGIPRVLFLHEDAVDPNRPDRRLRDVTSNKYTFFEFLLSQGL